MIPLKLWTGVKCHFTQTSLWSSGRTAPALDEQTPACKVQENHLLNSLSHRVPGPTPRDLHSGVYSGDQECLPGITSDYGTGTSPHSRRSGHNTGFMCKLDESMYYTGASRSDRFQNVLCLTLAILRASKQNLNKLHYLLPQFLTQKRNNIKKIGRGRHRGSIG